MASAIHFYNRVEQFLQQPEQRVAVVPKPLSSRQWLDKMAGWRDTFMRAKVGKVALFFNDSGELSAALFALWHCDMVACLAPNKLTATLAAMSSQVDACAGDFAACETVPRLQWSASETPLQIDRLTPLTPSQLALQLFTSGSSGQPLCIDKTLAQLVAEMEQLESTFGELVADCEVHASVSHQHIYGLLFRVLWPLATGRPFARTTAQYAEDFLTLRGIRHCLITSPTHLSRLPAELAALAGQTSVVFSSGAPLAEADSCSAADLLHAPVIEVLGSTETGGIGWRQQHLQQQWWQTFAQVKLKCDDSGVLWVASPYLVDDSYHPTGDLVELGESGFKLLGRADRLMKLEGKRLSLEQMEASLRAHKWVTQARLVAYQRGTQQRTALAAVLALSELGQQRLIDTGRRAFGEALKAHLRLEYEPVLLPRRWRYVEVLPVNSQGKLVAADLLAIVNAKQ